MEYESRGVVTRLQDRFASALIGGILTGARRSQAVRDILLRALSRTLFRSYVETYDREEDLSVLAHTIWYGRSLKPFFFRLLEERPRAARRLAQLAYEWARGVQRRDRIQRTGVVGPVTVVIEPTGACNLRCPGCYANSPSGRPDLPWEVWRDVVAEVRDMGISLVTLSGGEPFLREVKDRFITRLAEAFSDMGFLVYTNATLIDEEVARRVGEVGNIFPAISVEGYEHESDARRGKGYSDNAARVRERLAAAEAMYGFSATVTRQNAALVSSDEFLERRIAEGDLFGWYFILQPIGRNPDPSLMVSAAQRAHLREQIYKWRSQGRPILLGDFWNDGLLAGGCIAGGRSYFHIYSNGDISPCVFAPVACGNVLDIRAGRSEYRSLADFVNRHPFFVRFREKIREITDLRAPCSLIDHPENLRQICREAPWFPGNNMPKGYLDGPIAQALDAVSKEWQAALVRMPAVPKTVARDLEAIESDLRRRLRERSPRQPAAV